MTTTGGYVFYSGPTHAAYEDADVLRRLFSECGCLGPRNGEPKCPCAMRWDRLGAEERERLAARCDEWAAALRASQ